MKPKLLAALSIVLSSAFAAGVASAADPGATPPEADDKWTANAAQQRVALDYDLWPADSLVAMAWGLDGHLRIAQGLSVPGDSLMLDANYSWGYIKSTAPGGGDQGAYGNPTLGVHYTRPLDDLVENLRVYGGASWTPPVLSDPTLGVALAAGLSGSTRAGFDVHRLVPYFMTFRINAGAEYRILPNLYYRGDLNPVILVPTNGKVGADTEFVLEQSNEIEYRFDNGFGAGFRLQEAFTLSANDLIQTAMEPFVAYTPKGAGLYGRFGLLIALDEGSGFGFEKNKLASLKLTVGYQTE